MCDEHSILLHHVPVQAPWANGVCERGGGILKGLLECCVKSHSVQGLGEMNTALQECVLAYNSDINEAGVSPCQAAIGRQPRMMGDVLGNFSQRLAEHGLVDGNPSLARQVAMRETAKLAMVRLHFSRGIRRAELSRCRTSTMSTPLQPGDIVYFWRESKYNSKTSPSKKRLSLRRWHGPALLLALEGHSAGYVSFKGQMSKCAREHLRLASSMEQISAETWHDAIQECVEAALHDVRRPATEDISGADMASSLTPSMVPPTPSRLRTTSSLPPVPEEPVEALPPVRPEEFLQALDSLPELPGSGSLSRRASTMSSSRQASKASGSAAPGTPVPALIREASQAPGTPPVSSRLEASMETARELEEEQTSRKRAAEIEAEALRESEQVSSAEGHSVLMTTAMVQEIFKTKKSLMNKYAKEHANDIAPTNASVIGNEPSFEETFLKSEKHPLRLIQEQAEKDKLDPANSEVQDHGSWSGRWPLPSRTSWQAHELCCCLWPVGEHEVNAAKTARREVKWKSIPDHEKPEYKKAAEVGWKVQTDNLAFEPLSEEESMRVRNRLRDAGQLNKILHPRFIYTDKNDGQRSESRPLPLLANARLVIPGYQDETAYSVRKDAPTCARSSQHVLFITAASYGWKMWSADIKSAFLKGELFEEGERELYITNIRTTSDDEPILPFGRNALAKVRKGVFGLADSPRRWYLRLHKSVTRLGWVRSNVDAAQWFFYDKAGSLQGMMVSHVDDLLFAGTSVAKQTLDALGQELGFGSLDTGCFNYCGKQVKQLDDGSIEVSMQAYHENIQAVTVPVIRKKNLDSPLTPTELRQLRAVLGSLQWLVTQVRFDMSYHLSVLQGEPHVVRTLLKANALVRLVKKDSGFKLRFSKMDLEGAGILVVTDASLGNVTRTGGSEGTVQTKVFSQAAYVVLVADKELLAGREGRFCVLDARSHRLTRVCRSTYGAELLGAEESMDVGLYSRGLLAEVKGYNVLQRDEAYNAEIPLALVTDAKDVFDKSSSDTPTYGSQKSLAFTVSWLRETLRKPGTAIHWTATENMIIDCGTKDMAVDHFRSVINKSVWSYTFQPEFVKQSAKKKVVSVSRPSVALPGRPLSPGDPIANHLMVLAEQPGWRQKESIGIHVCRNARSFRQASPRFDPKIFQLRSTYARFDSDMQGEWRILEERQRDGKPSLIGDIASVLVTFFIKPGVESPLTPPLSQQEKGCTEESCLLQG